MIDTKLIDIAVRDKEFLASIPDDIQKEIEKVCSTCSSDKNTKKALFKRIHGECAQQLAAFKLKFKMQKKALGN